MRRCEVHNRPLQFGVARIVYGLLAPDEAYFTDQRSLFPHSNTWVGGGCITMSDDYIEVWFCPACREAEDIWNQVKKLLS